MSGSAGWRLCRPGAHSSPLATRRSSRTHGRRGNARLTIPVRAREKICAEAKKLLHRVANALISRPPNFARACGRVPVGGHPDKRPDSRPEQGQNSKPRASKPSGRRVDRQSSEPLNRQPEAKPAHPALNGGRGLKQRRSGLLWSRRPSKVDTVEACPSLPAVRNGISRSKPKAASRVECPSSVSVSPPHEQMAPLTR